jgi:hypothetical protein
MTNLATLLGNSALVDMVLGWRKSAFGRLTREGRDRDAAIAGANEEATYWVEQITGGTFSAVDDQPYSPPRPYYPTFVPPVKVHRQERLL